MNKVMLVGRLTRDPEMRTSTSGMQIASFSLAVNRNFRNKEGNVDADFINVVVFGKQAETIGKYVTKGQQLGVEGRIQTRSYDAQDGTKRYTTDVVIDNFEFVSGSNRNANQNANPTPSYNSAPANNYSAPSFNTNMQTTDISEDPYKEFSDETNISSDEFPF